MSQDDETGLQTLLLGLDGACTPVLDPLFAEGRLPALRSVFERAAVGPLRSQVPPWTPSAWPSLYTGVNPGRHGVFDFMYFEGYDWDIVDRSRVEEWALWELLSQHGHRSVVVNVPVTSPPEAFDGALIPGYVGPESPPCHPEGLLDEVREAIDAGDYRVYAPDVETDAERVEWYERLVTMRGQAFRYLVDRFDPSFGFLQFQQCDTVFHELPEDEAAIRRVFEAIDREVAAVLEACDPETVVVASDHGIGPYEGYEFRVNEYLRAHGYVESRKGGEGMPSWASISRKRIRVGEAGGERDRSTTERVAALAASVGVTSQRLKAVFDRLGLTPLVLRVAPADAVRAATEQVDFARSTAYMRSRTELGVRLNVAGREPSGVVPPGEYETVRDEVIEVLGAARTPEGEPVFESVAPREVWFDGPHTEDAVDVVTVPTDFDHYLSASLRGDHFDAPTESWNHKRDGVVALAGAGIDTGRAVVDAHLFDVAPTVLATLGVPPSDRMEGRVLPQVDAVPSASYPRFTSTTGDRESGDDAAIEARLADLGYLETTHDA